MKKDKAKEYHKPTEWMPQMVGGDNEPTDEVYVSKHGLRLRRTTDMGDHHWETFKTMADRDPDLISNMKAGRYMPLQNGRRIHYRGKDIWLGIKVVRLGVITGKKGIYDLQFSICNRQR